MAIRSGRMRHRFRLMKPATDETGQPARNGFGELTGDTVLVQTPWCNILDVESGEVSGTAISGQETIKFQVRWSKMLANPDTDMFIEFEDASYDITSSVDPHKLRERLEIMATKRR